MTIRSIIFLTGFALTVFTGINMHDIFLDSDIITDIIPENYEEIPEAASNIGAQTELEFKDVQVQTDLKSSDIKSSVEQLDDEIHFIENLQEDPDLYGITEDSPTTESTLTRHSSPDDRMDIVNKDRANKFDRIYVRK
jgi:hypothetical protein